MPGDHWRVRHDAMLHMIERECKVAGLPVEMEVKNIFVADMRQPGLSRAEQGRQLQGIVPDLRITMPAVAVGPSFGVNDDEEEEKRLARVGGPGGLGLAGQTSAVLHELKIISANGSRYKPTWTDRAVDVRASKLQEEYLIKARAADRRQGVTEGVVGRVEERLVSMGHLKGLVVGNFGELSLDFHCLIAAMATSRVRVNGPGVGRRGSLRSEQAERALVISGLRRRFGVMAVKCQASSLLGRLETLGPGGAGARGRRWQASELQRRHRQEEQVQVMAQRSCHRQWMSGFGRTG